MLTSCFYSLPTNYFNNYSLKFQWKERKIKLGNNTYFLLPSELILCQKEQLISEWFIVPEVPECWLVSPARREQTSLPLEVQLTRQGRVIPNGHSTHSNPGPRGTVKFLLQLSTLVGDAIPISRHLRFLPEDVTEKFLLLTDASVSGAF